MYHEYYTIIGGNININQECFNIDNTIYDSSSKNLMISAYSFYGINITLYNDQEIIETKIITNWTYIIINHVFFVYFFHYYYFLLSYLNNLF